ncbi:MAG: double zinc ribbon domain-containing protein, partial [Hymenobacteraceae bacterium]|nr:double zinc ribbon domain-containing protein [Hymenobacteraceae bacterium]MDX5397741.1 double zinc ribbon domain-containing protein [Hymenobacteraceae bacterium]MDX5444286.1 double zinc ribbon domain-containing protein [Hymenobacteraceae bacterium]MDX5513818.1 double zinc ribbon domain-containing protein [Hymenobacteraceae bacterium]
MMWRDLVALFFPEHCLACDSTLVKGEDDICTNCRVKLPYTELHLDATGKQNEVMRRFWGRLPLKYALVYMWFGRKGRVQKL